METQNQQLTEVTFFRGKGKGNRVLTRMPSGKLGIIDFNYKGKQIKEGDTWLVEVVKDEEKKAIVHPKKLIACAEDNENAVREKVSSFSDKGWKVNNKKDYKTYAGMNDDY